MSLIAPTGAGDAPFSVNLATWEGLAETRRAILLLMDPDKWYEVCTLLSRAKHSEWLPGGSVEAILQHAANIEHAWGQKGVYFTLNPGKGMKDGQASDEDMACRRWLFLDFDCHAGDFCATDEEKAEAEDAMGRCRDWLVDEMRWPEPVVVDSGNGYYLLFLLDYLENTELIRAYIRRATLKIQGKQGRAIDEKVTNISRLARLPGTLNRRGPHLDDRPQRRSRILCVPDGGPKPVPWEKIVEIAGEEPKSEPQSTDRKTGMSAPTRYVGGYGEKALLEEINDLESAPVGDRNNQLNKSAFSLFQLVAGGELNEGEVTARLKDASLAAGLGERETDATIKSAREAGTASPRSAPEKPASPPSRPPKKPPHSDPPKEEDPDEIVIRPASSITPVKVRWLWQDRIPIGKLTTFAGMGGLGKTFVLLNIAAIVSNGGEWPDKSKGGEPGKVIFISGEDDPEDTLVPRLIELGGDLKRVFFFTEKAMNRFTLSNLPLLEKGMSQAGSGVSLIVIDPPTAYLGGVDDHKNSELRQLLTPLKDLAQKAEVAIVFNTHVNKGGTGKVEAMARVMGSVAWVNAVRAAHLFAKDPDDGERRFFIPMKNNLGPSRKGLAYSIIKSGELAKVNWCEGEIDTTADQAAFGGKKKTRSVVAAEWMVAQFRTQLEWNSGTMIDNAHHAGISRSAIFEAKKSMKHPVKSRKVTHESGDEEWIWSVPKNWPGFAITPPEPPDPPDNGDGAEEH